MGPGTVRLGTDQLYDDLREVSAALYKKALTDLPPDVRHSVDAAHRREDGGARRRLEVMVKAIETSDETGIIVCQDTGICVFFVEIGTEAPVNGARMTEALRQGVALASERHSLRSSIVHPLTRENRQDNTGDGVPAVHVDFADGGDGLDILLIPKGSGSENMSFLSMLSPADGQAGVKKYILDRVVEAGPRPCPPTVVGVGLGGTADQCAALAKKATLRPVGQPHPEPEIAEFERQMLDAINTTGIGPQGLGGATTSFAVHVEYAWTHISMNPVAVNIQCWRGERARARIAADGQVTYGY
ncbi:fumarate hydratase [Actinomadura madurae]|uniref:fumarate hydratase n=1 Tax=Actinomadura madurae TaxID=1993 RepID=UPI0020273611|nr:fumarate hydratase [Actinomadura madurae]MCQ0007906.1 fumarate hydratase [Actinomadura madurae]URM96862.1 fumarate hydratase [Actinomadura madurae]